MNLTKHQEMINFQRRGNPYLKKAVMKVCKATLHNVNRAKKTVLSIAIIIAVFISCSKDTGTTNNPGGNTCTGTAKSYSADVSPIIQSSCATNSACHGASSVNGPGELLNYTQVFNARNSIRSAVSSGSMPKNSSLSATQKNNILCWIDSGAPNN